MSKEQLKFNDLPRIMDWIKDPSNAGHLFIIEQTIKSVKADQFKIGTAPAPVARKLRFGARALETACLVDLPGLAENAGAGAASTDHHGTRPLFGKPLQRGYDQRRTGHRHLRERSRLYR